MGLFERVATIENK